ncbi:MAG TPA: SRPBCC family protein, partial [Nocardioidaceae bacterium]|nr:SRPBCC family protein [Nocardioidaceae bacterium]
RTTASTWPPSSPAARCSRLRGCDCMELTHKFTVPASLDTTWAAFNDIEGVANCFPGAAVTSVEGDEFKGTVKVKLGPISLTYNGSGAFAEKDESAGRFVVEAKGKDRRGNGTAAATVTATMESASSGATDVEVLTDLSITGRPAQFGRGVIQDVSDKLLQAFIACLEQKLGGGAPEAPAGAPPAEGAAGAPPAEGAAAAADGATAAAAEEAAAAGVPPAEGAAAGSGAPGPEAAAAAASGAPGREAAAAAPGGPIGDGAGPAGAGSAGSAVAGVPSSPVEALDLGATVLPILLRRYWKAALISVGSLLGLIVLLRLVRRR